MGEPYRYSHPLPGGDDCTILAVDSHRALELVAHHAPGDAERPEAPFRLGHGLSSPRAAQLQYELLGLVRRGASRLALEDAVAELLHQNIPGKGHSYWHEPLGILHHDLYHAGQISLLKKAL